jgi:lysophospholipase L1-like esterase
VGHILLGARVDIEDQDVGALEKVDVALDVLKAPDVTIYYGAIDVCAGGIQRLTDLIRAQYRNNIHVLARHHTKHAPVFLPVKSASNPLGSKAS